MPKPDLLRVSVGGRLARLAGRGPPEGWGQRWRSEHAAATPPEKPGESPNADRCCATWFISPWRSDGAFLRETQPRVKVVTRAVRRAVKRHYEQTPARHKSNLAGATRTAMWPRRGGSFLTLASQAPTRPVKGSRAAGGSQEDRGDPLSPEHRRSGL